MTTCREYARRFIDRWFKEKTHRKETAMRDMFHVAVVLRLHEINYGVQTYIDTLSRLLDRVMQPTTWQNYSVSANARQGEWPGRNRPRGLLPYIRNICTPQQQIWNISVQEPVQEDA